MAHLSRVSSESHPAESSLTDFADALSASVCAVASALTSGCGLGVVMEMVGGDLLLGLRVGHQFGGWYGLPVVGMSGWLWSDEKWWDILDPVVSQ